MDSLHINFLISWTRLDAIHLLRLGPVASSAGGILVPMAPIGGRDE